MTNNISSDKKYDYWQESRSAKIGILLQKNSFLYFINDLTDKAKGEFIIPYLSLRGTVGEKKQSNNTYKYYTIYCLMAAAIYIPIFLFIKTDHIKVIFSPIFLLAAAVFFVLYKRSQVIYGILHGDEKNVYLLKTCSNYQEIVDILLKKRKEAYRMIYININPNNSPEKELNKYDWLLEQNIITKKEYEEITATLNKKSHTIN